MIIIDQWTIKMPNLYGELAVAHASRDASDKSEGLEICQDYPRLLKKNGLLYFCLQFMWPIISLPYLALPGFTLDKR